MTEDILVYGRMMLQGLLNQMSNLLCVFQVRLTELFLKLIGQWDSSTRRFSFRWNPFPDARVTVRRTLRTTIPANSVSPANRRIIRDTGIDAIGLRLAPVTTKQAAPFTVTVTWTD